MSRDGKWVFGGILLAVLAAPVAEGHEADPSGYGYYQDVRPIFVEHCSGCHREGGVAPMSLLDYQETVPWANAIKMQVLEKQMPPWLPQEGVSELRHQRTLTAEEIDVIVDWAVGQTPRGEPPAEWDGPSPPSPATSGPEPHVWLEPESEIVIGEDEYEKTHCLVLAADLRGERLLSGLEIRPGNPELVRRATVFAGSSCDEGRPLATWLPGQGAVFFPEAYAVELAARTSLAVELLYVKGWAQEGKRFTDRTALGLHFDSERTPLQSTRVASSRYALGADVELVAIYPNPSANEMEEPLRVEVTTPDGRTRPLLAIERFNPRWREKYFLARPIPLPAGSEIRVSQPGWWLDWARSGGPTAGEN